MRQRRIETALLLAFVRLHAEVWAAGGNLSNAWAAQPLATSSVAGSTTILIVESALVTAALVFGFGGNLYPLARIIGRLVVAVSPVFCFFGCAGFGVFIGILGCLRCFAPRETPPNKRLLRNDHRHGSSHRGLFGNLIDRLKRPRIGVSKDE